MNKLEESIPQKQEPLEFLNSLSQTELSIKLERSRISGAEKKAKAIVEARHKKQHSKFENYTDVVKSVKGLGEKTMLTMIDDWS
jgi:DNA uptake protein ComE-like DNA-binding protein